MIQLKTFMDTFQQNMEKIANQVTNITIDETENEYVIFVDLAGFNEEEISIKLKQQQILHIRAERDSDTEQEYYSEMKEKTVPLHKKVNPDNVTATYNNGILEIRAEKKEYTTHEISVK